MPTLFDKACSRSKIVPALHFNSDPLTKRRLRPGNGFPHELEPFGDVLVTQWIFGH
ncbi:MULTISPECIES: hypothetical protein [unclassified Bradyrhizobium]|uniref:hypothetical protein n=1 Tax=unclassified Bradyrhizobium TaxID=2631580 RepID=UPI001FF83AC0|nr:MULTISPECIES: hypothetical protein [unclassified Bradyrhizobium]MCK1534660.1 hypothetical protein [Bradyrhizobium sp. 176]MCK1557897.1 hypothetical protein [Bradyrhizobium sp. 171]UPJ98254.1 hypothetical protein IVB07_12525 [Bradyrhizobium sp. 172]